MAVSLDDQTSAAEGKSGEFLVAQRDPREKVRWLQSHDGKARAAIFLCAVCGLPSHSENAKTILDMRTASTARFDDLA